MKKIIGLIAMLGVAAMLLAGCSSAPAQEAEAPAAAAVPVDVEIREKMFIAQVNDVYVNPDEYLGKNIKLEGMFFGSIYEATGEPLYLVIRYGPGCCGDDDQAGFEVTVPEGIKIPENNDWVEAIGELEWYEELDNWYLRLNLKSLRVLDVRGAETVQQ